MDKSIYEIMKELLEEKKSNFTKDIKYLGTITSNEITSTGNVKVTRDIFVMFDEMPDGKVFQKFFDENKNFIAGCEKNGKLFPSAEFAEADISFLGQLENIKSIQGVSFNELDNKLEKVANKLGIEKKDIISMSNVELEQKIEEKDKPELTLENDTKNKEDSKEIKNQNNAILENISSKQETKLDNKVTDRYTLADILGIPAGSTLIAVYSNSISNNTNTTKFSFVIQEPDGTLKPCDMLEQDRGKTPDLDVYQTNRDGSEVEKEAVQSAYSINSPIVKNGVLTAKIGDYGTIELGYGQKGYVRNDEAMTQKLETDEVRYTTKEVLDQFSPQKEGVNGMQKNIDEGKSHIEEGHQTDLKDFDGNPNSYSESHENIIEMIKAYDKDIDEAFTDREIDERYKKMLERYPDASFEKVVELTQEDLAEDAYRMRKR